MRKFQRLLVAVLLAFTSVACADRRELTEAPAWSLPDTEGRMVHSTNFAGKVVLLNFWATWCGPCRMEIPSFVELQKDYGDQGLQIIGVSLDQTGPEAVRSFAKKFKMTYPVVMADAAMVDAYGGVEAIPATFVIDREGRIVKTLVGFHSRSVFENAVRRLFDGGEAVGEK